MGRRDRDHDRQRINLRLYLRLLSYLRLFRLRIVAIVLSLVGEALLTVVGFVMIKPVLDLVFLGQIFEIRPRGGEIPLVLADRGLTDRGTYVLRLGGALDAVTDTEPVRRVQGWLSHREIRRAVVDLRPLQEITDQGWSTLVNLLAAAEGRPVLILSQWSPPPDLSERLARATVSPQASPELAALADSVPAPDWETPEEAAAAESLRGLLARWKAWLGAQKEALLAGIAPRLEQIQSFALQSNRNKYLLLLAMAGLLVAITFLRCICGFFAGYLTGYVSDGIIRHIQDQLYHNMLYLDEAFYARRNTGTLMSHVMQDVTVTKDAIETVFLGILKGPINLVAVIGAMIWISPSLTLYTLVMFPALLAPMFWVARRVRRYSRRTQEKKSTLAVILHETFAGIRIVRAYATEEREASRFRRENWRLFRYRVRSAMADSAAAQMTIFLSTIAGCAVLLLNGYYILELGTLSGSDFVVFIGLMFTLYRPLKGMTKANNKIIQGMAGAERFFPVLDRRSEVTEKPGAPDLPPMRRGVRFEAVSFAYDREPVLRAVDFEVPAGRIVALVGASGSGKTTLVNLLPRFYDPTAGRILIDGVDIRDVTLRSLRRQIAIVTQESILFDDTVRNNIAYGQEDIDDARIVEAARAANAHDFIMEFPQGYATVIGDRGQRLSGGQRQRLAIARALIKNAPILILDEATSALDTESEREVQAAIDRLVVGRTAFVIAHRLSTIVNADEILVMRDGRIIERGDHEALLALGGEYARLHRLQFSSSDEEPASPAATPRGAPGD